MIDVRGNIFDFPVYDLDMMERYETADGTLRAALETIGADVGMPSLEDQKKMFAAYVAFFDETLGDGSLRKILDGKRNVMDAVEAYYDFRDAVLDSMIQRANAAAIRAKLPSKYHIDSIKG